MIRTLRKKFIAIAMLSLLGSMAVLCAVIGIGNYCLTAQRADRVIDTLYHNGGNFPAPTPVAGPSAFAGEFQVTPETAFETRYFIVKLTPRQEIYSVSLDHIAALDRQTVVTTVGEIVTRESPRGYVDQYRFGSFTDQSGGSTLIVVDCFLQLQSTYSMIRVIVAAFLICAAVVFVLLLVLSKHAIRPFAENWERQKQFVTDASHELKTPLAILSADMGLIEETEENRTWIDSARDQIVRMDALIKDLVELARSEEVLSDAAKAPVDLSALAAASAETFCPMAEAAGKTLSVSIAPEICVSGVPEELSRLLALLLDNAVKYCDNGGTIRLSTFKRGRTVCLELSNPCADVDAEQLPRWFDRFYRADASRSRATGGSGIGLSTAKAIVMRHRGKITNRYENGIVTVLITLSAAQ